MFLVKHFYKERSVSGMIAGNPSRLTNSCYLHNMVHFYGVGSMTRKTAGFKFLQ